MSMHNQHIIARPDRVLGIVLDALAELGEQVGDPPDEKQNTPPATTLAGRADGATKTHTQKRRRHGKYTA